MRSCLAYKRQLLIQLERETENYLCRVSPRKAVFVNTLLLRVSQGFWGTREHWQNIEGNKGTLANFWEQGTKFRKITVRKHSERVWEHGNIGQFWKGTREQGPPPWETLTFMRLGFILTHLTLNALNVS